MDNNHQHRGSQRALKMLQAHLQKSNSSGQVPAQKAQASRLPWPPRQATASLDLPATDFDQLRSLAPLTQSSSSSALPAPPTVTTPVRTRPPTTVGNVYASPEASIPSNGGFAQRESSVDFHDTDASRISFGGTTGMLAHDFNNSNTGFSIPGTSNAAGVASNAVISTDSNSHNHLYANDREAYHLSDEEETRGSMCFSLSDGKVTALVATRDGAYCIAGFSTGAIRLFDMTKGGNTDPEDRFGYQIGLIESNRGSVQVHMELGYALSGTENCSVDCCHLFAGARQGSTTMLVVDIGFLREVHKKRGFISVAGGGVQVLHHSDARLKGLASLTTVSATPASSTRGNEPPSGSQEAQNAAAESVAPSRGYAVTYRMVTGIGFCSYHVWEVSIDARTASGQVSSPLGNSSAGGGGSSALVYKQGWRHLFQGTVNGPTMGFAHFVTSSPAWGAAAAAAPTGTLSLWEQCQQHAELDRAARSAPARPLVELVVSDKHKDLRAVALSSDGAEAGHLAPASKPSALKDTVGTYACSRDGRIFFGGQYELIVSVLESGPGGQSAGSDGDSAASLRISYRAVFSLSDFAPGVVGPSSKKSTRHLREISDVRCTPDGCYALILCTDSAVLLYSACDVTGKSSFPTRTEGGSGPYRTADDHSASQSAGQNSGGGFLTYLFEAGDAFNLDLGIAYAFSDAERSDNARISTYGGGRPCSCGIHSLLPGTQRPVHHLPPENVLISISWWLVENPLLAGVLKVGRLKLPGGSAGTAGASSPNDTFQQVIPAGIATSALVIEQKASASGSGSNGRRRESAVKFDTCCALCSDATVKHWADDALTENERSLRLDPGTAVRAAEPALSQVAASSSSTARAPEKDRRPPVGKKKDVARKDPEVQAAGTSAAAKESMRGKRQKVAHFSPDATLPRWENRTDSDYFCASDSDVPMSQETSRIAAPASSTITSTSFEENTHKGASRADPVEVDLDADAEVDDASNLGRHQSTESLDEEDFVPGNTQPSAVSKARAEPATGSMNVRELRQELDRVKAENRRLRIDTDLTMRKADRRFELEMVARRYWKREKTELEEVIANQQKDQQRWVAEKEKLKRLHGLLQNVMYAASSTLESSLDFEPDNQVVSHGTGAGAGAGLQSPAAQLRSELTAVGKGETTATFASKGSAGSSNTSGGGGSSTNNGRRIPFFCIVCLDHTARVAIQPCGHICFCVAHAEEMQQRVHDHHYSKCPLCQVKITNFLTLQGIDV